MAHKGRTERHQLYGRSGTDTKISDPECQYRLRLIPKSREYVDSVACDGEAGAVLHKAREKNFLIGFSARLELGPPRGSTLRLLGARARCHGGAERRIENFHDLERGAAGERVVNRL